MELHEQLQLACDDVKAHFAEVPGVYVVEASCYHPSQESDQEARDDGWPEYMIEAHNKGYGRIVLCLDFDEPSDNPYSIYDFDENKLQQDLRNIFLRHVDAACLPDTINYECGDQEFFTPDYTQASSRWRLETGKEDVTP